MTVFVRAFRRENDASYRRNYAGKAAVVPHKPILRATNPLRGKRSFRGTSVSGVGGIWSSNSTGV